MEYFVEHLATIIGLCIAGFFTTLALIGFIWKTCIAVYKKLKLNR